MSKNSINSIKNYPGYKILFRQDEYRMIHKSIEYINSIFKINLLISTLNPGQVNKIYPPNSLQVDRIVTQLPGYVDDHKLNQYLKQPIRTQRRPIDIGYRGRTLPPYFGKYPLHKAHIGQIFINYLNTHQPHYHHNIAVTENKRLYGKHWYHFLNRCHACLGTQGGSTLHDPLGQLQTLYEKHQSPINSYSDFEKLAHQHVGDVNKYQIKNLKIPPRCFEYMLHQNVMILLKGRYSGILKPDLHYIPINKNYHNLDQVCQKLDNQKYAHSLLSNVRHLLKDRTDLRYSSMVKAFDQTIEQLIPRRTFSLTSKSKLPPSLKASLLQIKNSTQFQLLAHHKYYSRLLGIKNYFFYQALKTKNHLHYNTLKAKDYLRHQLQQFKH
jgi:hypothetical protein